MNLQRGIKSFTVKKFTANSEMIQHVQKSAEITQVTILIVFYIQFLTTNPFATRLHRKIYH